MSSPTDNITYPPESTRFTEGMPGATLAVRITPLFTKKVDKMNDKLLQ